MRILVSLATALLFVSSAFAQQTSLSPQTPPKALPDLEHFNTTNVDAKADPCEDFYGYAEGRWLAAHPIPADQATWGVASPLRLWNETVLLLALEQNSANDPKRTPSATAFLPGLRIQLVRAVHARVNSHVGPHQSTLLSQAPREQCGREQPRVPAGLRVPRRAENGAPACLPHLVILGVRRRVDVAAHVSL